MSVVNITNARANLYEIANQVIESHEHVMVTSKKGNFVMLAEEDFQALLETVYLQSIPGLSKEVKILNESSDNDLISRKELEW